MSILESEVIQKIDRLAVTHDERKLLNVARQIAKWATDGSVDSREAEDAQAKILAAMEELRKPRIELYHLREAWEGVETFIATIRQR